MREKPTNTPILIGVLVGLKMDLTEGSETSANINQTPGNHPKVDILNTEHGKSLKPRK
jgi:hypothetical protein